jgi:hypothetical protein
VLNKAEMKIAMVMVFAKTRMDSLFAYVTKVLLMMVLPTAQDALIHCFHILTNVRRWSDNTQLFKRATNAANYHFRCQFGSSNQLNQIYNELIKQKKMETLHHPRKLFMSVRE